MGWIGIDLDGVLAEWGQGTSNPENVLMIGDPIPATIALVKRLLAEGYEIRIFTARVGPATDEECKATGCGASNFAEFCAYQAGLIDAWTAKHLQKQFTLTCVKDFHMYKLYDDRAVQMIPNTGVSLEERVAELAASLSEI